MNLFGRKHTRSRSKPRAEPDAGKIAGREKARVIKESFPKIVKAHPELEMELVCKEFGLTPPTKPPMTSDEETTMKAITKAAIDSAKDNPELMQDIGIQKLHEYAGTKPTKYRNRDRDDEDRMTSYEDDESPLTKAIREIRELQEFKEELGLDSKNKGGFTDLLKDPDVIKAFFGFLAAMKSPEAPQSQPPMVQQVPVRTYVVQTEQGMREMSESDYLRLRQSTVRPQIEQKPKPPIVKPPEVKAPDAHVPGVQGVLKETTPSAKTNVVAPEKLEPAPEDTFTDDPIMNYLNLEPAQFVKQLIEESEGDPEDLNVQQAIAIREMIRGATFEDICEIVKPYKDNPKYEAYVAKILDRKEWVEAVIKELYEAEEQMALEQDE
jgi:hypothetical protein